MTAAVVAPGPALAVPSAPPRERDGRDALRTSLLTLAVLGAALAVHIGVLSNVQHASTQRTRFADLRGALAKGTAPVGPTDVNGKLLALGTPVALLEIPSLHLKEVIGEGTTGGVLALGPGHRRDSPLPGQRGTSVLYGRAGAYGHPFSGLSGLKPGAKVTVTTGLGVSTFRVVGPRRAGDLTPPAPASGSRLVLTTASGTPFMPSGVLRVDADLEGEAFAAAAGRPTSASLPAAEAALGNDTSTVWALVLWLQALLIVAIGVVVTWRRWGKAQTWIVGAPLLAVVGLSASDQLLRLLPNLL